MGGERELIRGVGKARRGDQDHPGRSQHPGHGDNRQREGQQARYIGDKHPGGVFALLIFVLCEDRHERLGKGAFGKDAAQQVGQLERHKEGVGRHSGAKHPRHNGVACKTQHARKQGHRADGGQRF